MTVDPAQQEARRALRDDAAGMAALFSADTRAKLMRRVGRALSSCRDYNAALDRHRRHRHLDIYGARPLFRQVEQLIADIRQVS